MGNRTIIVSGLLMAAVLPAQGPAPLPLTFGAYSFKKPTEVYKEFEPVIVDLQARLGLALGRPVQIEIRLSKTYEECLNRFVAGEIDFVRFGPASYVVARQQSPRIQLLAIEHEAGQKICKGVIAVRAGSEISSLAQLKGRRFAFGDEMSTIGRYLSQARLAEAGIVARDLSGHAYLERHDKVFKAVEIGDYDAGAMHIATFRDLNKDGQLRVIDTFDNVGKPWIARAGLDEPVVAALRSVLAATADPAALKALKADGLLASVDSDFDFVRKGMQAAERFLPTPSPAVPPPAPHKD